MKLAEDSLEGGAVHAKRERVGKDGDRPGIPGFAKQACRLDACFRDISRRPFGEQARERILDARRGAVGDEDGGEMRAADDRASGNSLHLFVCDRQAELT